MKPLRGGRFYDRWLRQPRSTWLRKAVFQVHLWSGLILGLYIVVVCASGSAIVFRNDFYDFLLDKIKVTATGPLLNSADLARAIEVTYPGFSMQSVRPGRDALEASEVTLTRVDGGDGSFFSFGNQKRRLVDPYTGRDRGPAVSQWFRILVWLSDLHGRFFLGAEGMTANAIGGALTAAVCLTGMVIWWPGVGRVRRAMTVRWRTDRTEWAFRRAGTGNHLETASKSQPVASLLFAENADNEPDSRSNSPIGWKRFNFDLHSAVGFWTFGILFVWGVTGFYFVFPQPFRETINYFTPILPPTITQITIVPLGNENRAGSRESSPVTMPLTRRRRRPLTLGGKILRAFSYAHYGNFAGWPVKAVWVLLGFAPVILFGSGLVMWWNRVLSPIRRRWVQESGETPVRTI